MPYADVNGQRLFFQDSGSGDDAVVFSHGLFMDHTMFDEQVRAFRARWRCIAWDERGHGRTETTDDPFSYWDSAGDLLGLLDQLSVERAVLAGMSQGGFVSMRAALSAPERVRALVLIDTQPGVEDPEKVPLYDQMMDAWMAPDGPPQQVIDTVAGIIIGQGYPDTPAWQDRWRAMPKPTVLQNYTTLMGRDDISDRLSDLTMPVLVIHGTDDVAIELPIAEAVVKDLPSGELAVIEGAGHAANLTHPEPVNAALAAFLARV